MASLLRRVKQMVGVSTDPRVRVATPDGSVEFADDEAEAYKALFRALDYAGERRLTGEAGAAFLRRSGLAQDALREVWRLACGGESKPELDESAFCLACKLIALVQAGHELSTANAVAFGGDVALAEVGWPTGPWTGPIASSEIPPASISVSVTSPQTLGSGMNKYTVYSVTTSTSLDWFPVRDGTVPRRYSDFAWLHERLCAVFPSAIIPLFPEKNTLQRMSMQFVMKRMGDLEVYMSRVVHHPLLGRSPDLVAFLTAAPAQWEASKAYVAAATKANSEDDDLVSKVVNAGAGGALSVPADETFDQHREFHSRALARIHAAVRVAEDLHRKAHEAERALQELGAGLSELGNAESDGKSASASVVAARIADEKSASQRKALLDAYRSASTSALPTSKGGAAAGGGGGGSVDDSAAAFAAHEAAVRDLAGKSQVDAMFASSGYDDDHGGGRSGARGGAGGGAGAASVEETGDRLTDLLRASGATLSHVGSLARDHLDRVDKILADPMRVELVREREIDDAARRRELAVVAVHNAHALLQRRRKAYTALSSKDGNADHAEKVRKAEAAAASAEKFLERKQKELEAITAGIQREMIRVMRSRRVMLAEQLLQLAQQQQRLAQAREDVWDSLIRDVVKPSEDQLARASEVVQSRLDGAVIDSHALEVDESAYKDKKQFRGPDLSEDLAGSAATASSASSSSAGGVEPVAAGAAAGGGAAFSGAGRAHDADDDAPVGDDDDEVNVFQRPEPTAPVTYADDPFGGYNEE